ncbi:uncharacterized protein DS421_6g197260 [Arachis hypogaea]|nr:uncharacterized protein DS421_6g197260 [Arachis hypogaea]
MFELVAIIASPTPSPPSVAPPPRHVIIESRAARREGSRVRERVGSLELLRLCRRSSSFLSSSWPNLCSRKTPLQPLRSTSGKGFDFGLHTFEFSGTLLSLHIVTIAVAEVLVAAAA